MKKDSVIKNIYKLTPMQEGMLYYYLRDKTSEMYFEQTEINIEGDMEPSAIEKSLNIMIGRHDAFRTVFKYQGVKQPIQVILKERSAAFYYKDISCNGPEERLQYIELFKHEDRKKSFDLSTDILLRLSVFREDKSYRLIFSFHHIILDGWSMGIVLSEFFDIYNSLVKNKPLNLSDSYPYSNYMRWLELQNRQEAEQYWKNYLKDYNVQAGIPGIESETYGAYERGEYSFYLERELTSDLMNLSNRLQVTLSTVLQSLWGVILQKYNNTNDVVYGLVVSGRPSKVDGVEKTVGVFINTIPIRVNCGRDMKFSELLKDIQNSMTASEKYNYLTLAEIQSHSDLKRNLINNLMAFENYPISSKSDSLAECGLRIISIDGFEQSNYNFNISFSPGEMIKVKIVYNSLIYDKEIIYGIGNHLTRLIRCICQNPDIAIRNIDVLAEQERVRILNDFNKSGFGYTNNKTIHKLFEEQVNESPDSIALVSGDTELTYREVNDKANNLAGLLRKNGIKEGSIVAILIERSIDMIIAVLGVLKAGGAYMPIDPGYPKDRTLFMLEDSGAAMLLTTSLQAMKKDENEISEDGSNTEVAYSESFKCKVFYLDLYNYNKPGLHEFIDHTDKSSLAYIMYTSGTTGMPKGTLITHSNISRVVKNTNYINITGNDVILQLSNYAFDGSVFDIFGALANGAKLVLVEKATILDVYKLSEFIKEKGITVFFVTTALFNIIVDINIKCFENVRKVLFGGERASINHVKKAFEYMGANRIIHVYGPTESTVYATYYNVNGVSRKNSTVPIGIPIAGTGVYIVDRDGHLQPVGITGELCISGEGLSKGYLNKPELTAEKFVDNPFGPGEKMYKTGDLGRWLSDGNIEFVGRIDNQVKIRGFRIELEEIEAKLLKNNSVKEASVIARENQSGEKSICAYLVPSAGITITDIKAYLAGELPEYMVPSYFVQLLNMPLNKSGKIDKNVLPEPEGDINTGVMYAAPRNEVEEKLAKMWEEILGVKNIGINDNFFELGGHSLKATILMSKIHKELCTDIPLKEIFSNPTISAISECIDKSAKKEGIVIEPAGKREYYPVSSSQKRVYVLSRINTEGVQYNIPMAMYIEGMPDRERFKDVFRELVRRHESFRTSFEMVDGEPVQKIHDEADFEIEYEKEPDEEKLNEIIKAFVRPFDLFKAPLMRVKLVEVREDKHLLLLDIHHIISDGMSLGVLFKEIAGIYRGDSLALLRIQYKDFAVWQNEHLKADVIKKQENYWLDVLSGELPVLDMVTDYPRPAIQSFEGDRIEFSAGCEITEGLRRLAAETGATMYMVLLAAYNVLLSKYSRQEDIMVGSPIAGRPYADVQNVVGMFVNTLVMRNRPAGELTFKEFLYSVKGNALKAYENQEYQFEELVEKVDVKRNLSRNPIFDTMFAMQNMDIKEIDIEGLKFQPYTFVYLATKLDLTLTAMEESNGISFNLEYCSKLFKRTTVESITKHYINILRQAVLYYDKKISEIDIATEEEKKCILYEFNRTSVNYPQDKTIHELFEQQVSVTPDKTALVYKDESITYSELNQKANRLAGYIRTKGIKANDVVGIMTENSIEMIEGIIGILKSGAAYLPIDPSYPEDRINYMLDNSNAVILLSRADTIKKFSVAALQRNQNKSIKGFNREIIMLDSEYGTDSIEGNLNCAGKPDDLAYVIYTSGSTGEPKGVMVDHRSVINFCEWYKNYYKITDKDKSTKYAGVGFDVSVLEIFPHLLNGAELHIIGEDIKLDMKKLGEYYKKNSITISFLPTQICEQFMVFGQVHVKQLLTGGDKLIRYIPGSYKLINNYGPTENTVVTTSYVVDNECTNIPIGKPVDNSRVYILDRYLKLQPVGLPGELCISGRSLARGYINDEELTRRKFVENPYEAGEKLYRTGDLARWLPDGNIEFLGRIDNQVKIRGFRIELGEIELRLLKFESIAEAVAVVLEDKNGEKYICAYITSSVEVDMLKLRQYLAKQLPEYMIPAHFIKLDKIPLNQNDKIDRKRLPRPISDNYPDTKYVAPRNEVEEMLVNIWRDVLGIDTVGIYDNFFELGGDSIKAIRVISRLSVNYSVSANDIFENQTVAEFGKRITKICVIERIKELGNAENEIAIHRDNDSPNLVNEQLSAQIEAYNKSIQLYKDMDIHADRGYKNIMLFGSTGYLGIYILKDLLENTNSNIYLLIRGDTAEAAEERLKKKIRFYFDESLYSKNKSRIIVLNGDISKESFGLSDVVYNDISNVVECIINSAGNVKHYGKYEDFYKTNVLGIRNLVSFAENHGLKDFNHISTMSVAYGNEDGRKHCYFTEYENCTNLNYDNYYIRTKQEAEMIIQEARNKGINCNIYRVGNLVFDSDTGGFQENISENNFYKTMKSYIKVLAFPKIESMTFDFSSIDYVSKAIVLLMATNLKNENYHIYNSNYLDMLQIGKFLKKSIPELQILGFAEFLNYLDQEYNKGTSREYIENIIFQYSMEIRQNSTQFITMSDKTNLILGKVGFLWPMINEVHINKMVEHCRAVNYL